MLAAMLTAAGYRTGLYTSPHLLRLTERMRIDGAEISPEDLAGAVAALARAAEGMAEPCTEFELITRRRALVVCGKGLRLCGP